MHLLLLMMVTKTTPPLCKLNGDAEAATPPLHLRIEHDTLVQIGARRHLIIGILFQIPETTQFDGNHLQVVVLQILVVVEVG